MKKVTQLFLLAGALFVGGCDKYLDINNDPNRQKEDKIPMAQVLTGLTLNVGFTGGSDIQRHTGLIMQHYSGQTTGGETQTQAFEKYLIQATELNNLFSSIHATSIQDAEMVIKQAKAEGSPHYAGVAKLLKAYTYHQAVDVWGDQPFSEAQQLLGNLFPKYDNDEEIYTKLFTLIDEALTDINAASSIQSPGTNSTIYTSAWAAQKPKWIRFANTLKLRLYIHYSKFNKADAVAKMTTLVNSGAEFFTGNADNFSHVFQTASRRQNPIHQFELDRSNYIFPNNTLVSMMVAKADPRLPFYFTDFPANSGTYKGAKAADVASQKYSRIHSYLRGAVTNVGTPLAGGDWNGSGVNSISYNGAGPIRMLTFAEYNFIRAEAALYGAPGDAQTFFTAAITAAMSEAGVTPGNITTYLGAHGTLAGMDEDKLKQIIEEKYVSGYGVAVEPWSDWRRTGYPVLTLPSNAILNGVPRSLLYPASEIELNRNAPPQKANMLDRVFWDKP